LVLPLPLLIVNYQLSRIKPKSWGIEISDSVNIGNIGNVGSVGSPSFMGVDYMCLYSNAYKSYKLFNIVYLLKSLPPEIWLDPLSIIN